LWLGDWAVFPTGTFSCSIQAHSQPLSVHYTPKKAGIELRIVQLATTADLRQYNAAHYQKCNVAQTAVQCCKLTAVSCCKLTEV
jgi:hypothetical protein